MECFVYDTLSTENEKFEKESKCIEIKFKFKQREYSNFTFSGKKAETRPNGSFRVHQESIAKAIAQIPVQ